MKKLLLIFGLAVGSVFTSTPTVEADWAYRQPQRYYSNYRGSAPVYRNYNYGYNNYYRPYYGGYYNRGYYGPGYRGYYPNRFYGNYPYRGGNYVQFGTRNLNFGIGTW
ncbi:MAG: hypothetical protein SFX18_13595 [Pirellulales bacterium]|nr:hypothetical protein [Pirellulales bacterium]